MKTAKKNSEALQVTLADKAYRHLLGALLRRELVPGMIINRQQVADYLKMSVAPVLEAMVQLEAEGFLEAMPRQGTRVRLVNPREVHDQWLLRIALESYSARLVCGEIISSQLARLEPLADTVDRSEPGTLENATAEVAFHRALVDLCDSPGFMHVFDGILRRALFFQVHNLVPPPEHKQNPRAHRDLLVELQKPNPDHAEKQMRVHLTLGREALLRYEETASPPWATETDRNAGSWLTDLALLTR